MPKAITFAEAFRTGIRRDWRTEKRKDVLLNAQGLRATEFGLKDILPITELNLLSDLSAHDLVWPYPELVRGIHNAFIIGTISSVPTLVKISDTFAPTAITLYQYDDWVTPLAMSLTGQPHLAEAAGNVMIFTGDAVIFNAPATSKWFYSMISSTKMTINTGCGFRDRQLIFGGFNPANVYALAQWDASLESLGLSGLVIDLGPNSVVWTSHAGMDIPDARMFFSSGGTYGMAELIYGTHPQAFGGDGGTPGANMYPGADWGPTKPWILEQRKRQEFGAVTMPWRGMVERILPIGQETGVVVYGDDGVTGLVPVKAGAPSFGRVDIAGLGDGYGVGALGRSMAMGDFNEHIFIGEDGVLWAVDAAFKATKISDNKLFDPARWSDPTKVRISKDTEQGEYYLVYNDGTLHEAYLLSRRGITRVNDSPTSISCYLNGRVGHMDTTTTPLITWAQGHETNWFDGGVDDTWIVSGLRTDCPFWIFYIDYLVKSSDDPVGDLQSAGPFTCDDRGVCNGFQVQGALFKVRASNTNDALTMKAETLELTIGRAGEEGKMKLGFLMP